MELLQNLTEKSEDFDLMHYYIAGDYMGFEKRI